MNTSVQNQALPKKKIPIKPAKSALPATEPPAQATDVEDEVAQNEAEATKRDAPTQEKTETSSVATDTPPVVLAQNTNDSTPAAAIRGVANTAVGSAIEEEQVAALVIPPAAGAGISGTTMAMVGVGGLALAGGGGGGSSTPSTEPNGNSKPPNNTAPVSPTLSTKSLSFSADTGVSKSDFITKTATQTITGQLSEALGLGQAISVSADNGKSWTQATVKSDQTWTATTTLVNGGTNLLVAVVDTNNNNANLKTLATQSYTLKTTAPAETIDTVNFSADTGASNHDYVTNTKLQTISGVLDSNLKTGENVYLSLDSGVTWTPASTSGVGSLNWSFVNVSLLSGTNPLWFKVADVAGNDGLITKTSYTLDTTSPTQTINAASVEGATLSNNVYTVTNTTQKINGVLSAALQNTESVQVSVDNGQTWNFATVTDKTWTYTNSTGWRIGSGQILSRVVDIAGNTGAVNSTAYMFAGPLQLSGSFNGFVINGQSTGDFLGGSVSGVGDINGDGLSDFIISTSPAQQDPTKGGAFITPRSSTVQSFVVFGKTNNTAVNISDIAASRGGFVINGQSDDTGVASVSSAGDINGDGLADFIIGVPRAAQAVGTQVGRSYVVFGKTNTSAVNLSAVAAGSGGFVINGQNTGDNSGFSVSGAGDVNGDGVADLIVGSPFANPNNVNDAGLAYVVFGRVETGNSSKPITTPVNLSAIAAGTGGFVINDSGNGNWNGFSVSGVGDVNGDGFADIFVGAPFSNRSDPNFSEKGRGYLVFGKSSTTAVNLSAVVNGSGGFVINGEFGGNHAGHVVSGAGDVNGDGLADLIIGAPFGLNASGTASPGYSYVVFGKTNSSAINLSAVAAGNGGFVIRGLTSQPGTVTGFAVASAGDFNGDGLADLIVGAPGVDVTPPGGTQLIDAGSSFLVYGKTTGTTIELSDVVKGVGGFAINAAQASGLLGLGVSSAGDVNGDGLADLLIGAPGTPGTATSTGTAYIIFGGQDASSKIDFLGTTGKDTLIGTTASETFVGNLGDDILTGNGGADVMYGGAGNDTFVLNADNITKLVNGGVVNGHHALVDGGSGLDTIWLSGTGLTFDLTAIKDAAGVGAPDVSNSLNSIERINLTNFGANTANASNNTLKLSAKDLINLSNFNVFSDTVPIPPDHNHQLMVDGDASSKVILTGSWVHPAGLYNFNGNQYDFYYGGNTSPLGVAELLVNHLITSVTVL